jgi:hypothetical protein
MGLGDNLMATGMARGAAARGKRIALGDGTKIIWDQNSEQIFRNNINVAAPGSEGAADLEWVHYYKGNRIYNTHDAAGKRWVWNYNFKAIAGEMFFDKNELAFGKKFGKNFVIVEPYVPEYKMSAPNKTWPINRYANVVGMLKAAGIQVVQFNSGKVTLPGTTAVITPTFRHALAVMAHAALYIGPEGGLHHGAAAVDIPAVVLFGGFIPPEVTGYDNHINLTGGAQACGSLTNCDHCKTALENIASKHVYRAAKELLKCEQQPANN